MYRRFCYGKAAMRRFEEYCDVLDAQFILCKPFPPDGAIAPGQPDQAIQDLLRF